jgi:hypothetical protein
VAQVPQLYSNQCPENNFNNQILYQNNVPEASNQINSNSNQLQRKQNY